MSPAVAALVAGMGLGLSLIVAIGAQNLFVLRQGLRREHVGIVVVICIVSDAALIVVGISGVGLALQAVPWLADVVRVAGAAFLGGYALLAARRALSPRGSGLTVADGGDRAREGAAGGVTTAVVARPRAAALTALALTWLNPHVYLDTVFLLGGMAAAHGEARWWFGVGAVVVSVAWFAALGGGARRAGRWLARPAAWRAIDAVVAVTMAVLATSLLIGM